MRTPPARPREMHRIGCGAKMHKWSLLASLALALSCPGLLLPGNAQAYALGHLSVTYTDPARPGRSIPCEIYYPAETGGEGVPVAPPPVGGFPVVTFGHGFLMSWDSYAYLWEALVPSGYIMAMPRTEGSLFPSHAQFGADLAFLVVRLRQEGAAPGSLFEGAVAATAAVAGHSMGGGASFLAAGADETITALWNLAAAETNPSAIAAAGAILAPALLFSGSYDCVTPPPQHQEPMYEALASDCKTLAGLNGASHCQFADANTLCELGEGGCLDPAISREQQHALVLQLLVPWLDHILKAEPGAWTAFLAALESPGVEPRQSCPIAGMDEPGEGGRADTLGIKLGPAQPNPFHARTAIEYELPRAGTTTVAIFSPSGRLMRLLVSEEQPAGRQRLEWDGRDGRQRSVPAGIYWCRVHAGTKTAAIRLLKIR